MLHNCAPPAPPRADLLESGCHAAPPLAFSQTVAQSPRPKEDWMEAWRFPVSDWFQCVGIPQGDHLVSFWRAQLCLTCLHLLPCAGA